MKREVMWPEDYPDHPDYRPWRNHGRKGWSCKHCGGLFRSLNGVQKHLDEMGVWPKRNVLPSAKE